MYISEHKQAPKVGIRKYSFRPLLYVKQAVANIGPRFKTMLFLWSSTKMSKSAFQHYQIQPARDMPTYYIHISCGHAPGAGYGFSVRCVQDDK